MNIRDVPPEKVVVNNFFISHSPEDEDRLRGMYVAWSLDGRTALAAALRMSELFDKCDELGLIGGEYVCQYMRAD